MKKLFDTISDTHKSYINALIKKNSYVNYEFQDFAYRLALKLGDLDHKGIYFRLAKYELRSRLEVALAFACDYTHEPNKGKLFMWKLKQIREEAKERFEKLDEQEQNAYLEKFDKHKKEELRKIKIRAKEIQDNLKEKRDIRRSQKKLEKLKDSIPKDQITFEI